MSAESMMCNRMNNPILKMGKGKIQKVAKNHVEENSASLRYKDKSSPPGPSGQSLNAELPSPCCEAERLRVHRSVESRKKPSPGQSALGGVVLSSRARLSGSGRCHLETTNKDSKVTRGSFDMCG